MFRRAHVISALALTLPGAAFAGDTAPPAVKVGDGSGVTVTSDDGSASMNLSGRIQARGTVESVVDSGEVDAVHGELRRARLKLKGHVLDKQLRYQLQVGWDRGAAGVKDAYVDVELGEGPLLRVGQTKRPFGRDQIGSSSVQSQVDRAITNKAFGQDRDIGLYVHNGVGSADGLEYAAGVFNGTGVGLDADGTSTPDMWLPTAIVRVAYNQGGKRTYGRGDFEQDGAVWGVGLNLRGDLDAPQTGTVGTTASVDAMVKPGNGTGVYAAGYASMGGADLGAQDLALVGGYLDLDHTIGKTWLPGVRYAVVMVPDGALTHEIGGAVAVMANKHKAKWTTGVSAYLSDDGAGATGTEVVGQTQLEFGF